MPNAESEKCNTRLSSKLINLTKLNQTKKVLPCRINLKI